MIQRATVKQTTGYANALDLAALTGITEASIRAALAGIGAPGQDHVTQYDYDAAHRLISQIKAFGTASRLPKPMPTTPMAT